MRVTNKVCGWTIVAVAVMASELFAGQVCPGNPECEQPFPDNVGPEIWVSGPEVDKFAGAVRFPDVAVDEFGQRIYVWQNAFPVNPQRSDIILRRFGPDGLPLEDPRVINTTTDSDQGWPRVAVSADGSFLVVWQSFEDDSGTFRYWVRSQAFLASGQPDGVEQLLSTVSTGSGTDANVDVAALRKSDGSSGGYSVAWRSFNTTGGDNSSASIEMRLVSAGGVPTGPQMQINSIIAGQQDDPAVAELADGRFLVVWTNPELQGRIFSAAGAPSGPQFQINTAFSSTKSEPDVAIGWDGVVAVVWEDPEDAGDGDEVRARLYKLSGADLIALGPDFRVNTLATNEQEFPRLGDYGPMGFLVTWQSDSSVGTDPDDSIQARLMTGQNTFSSDQVQYSVWETDALTTTNKENPASHGWYGRVASAWRSVGNDQDPSPFDEHITGRDIEYCLYCDDFEWFDPGGVGSLWRWSATSGAVP